MGKHAKGAAELNCIHRASTILHDNPRETEQILFDFVVCIHTTAFDVFTLGLVDRSNFANLFPSFCSFEYKLVSDCEYLMGSIAPQTRREIIIAAFQAHNFGSSPWVQNVLMDRKI